jgi:predicted dinucleotide-binding enzyme
MARKLGVDSHRDYPDGPRPPILSQWRTIIIRYVERVLGGQKMRIAIIGTGRVGSVLGRKFAAAGHSIRYGSRDPESSRVKELLSGHPGDVSVTKANESIRDAGVVIYAAPYDNAEGILRSLPDLQSAVLIDCTNPLNAAFDGLQLGHTESAGERIAEWAPTARVIKAFNSTSVSTLQDPRYGDQIATQFYCGDDLGAKQIVARLIEQLGMEPVDAGPLKNARYLEATAMMYIYLAVRGGWGSNCALKMLRR